MSRNRAAAVAGALVFAAQVLPVIVIWFAGAHDPIGEAPGVAAAVVLVGAAIVAAVGAWLMTIAVDRVGDDPLAGRYDAWAALFVGIAVLATVLALLPSLMLLVLVPDEGEVTGVRAGWVAPIWVIGHFAAVALAALAGRLTLRRGSRRALT